MFARTFCVSRVLSKMSKQKIPPGLYLQFSASSQTKENFDLKQNAYFEKYAAKLEHLKKTQPELYEEKMAKLLAAYAPEPVESEGSSVDPEHFTEAAKSLETLTSQTKDKKLESLMKVELLVDKTSEEIEEIWKTYHSDKECVYAVIPTEHYEEIQRRSKEFPTFLYPVPRQGGYEFFVQQSSNNSCYFTTLGAFQQHKENAPPCFEINYFTELKDKGIVLMRGEPDKNILSVYEAQLLALQVKIYYGINSGLKFNLVRLFNNSPDKFRFLDLVKEFENYKKDSKEFIAEYKKS